MLTFVLLCSGKGADPNLYRPHRDDSQWWGRRDAQARCVTAALYGPFVSEKNESHVSNSNRSVSVSGSDNGSGSNDTNENVRQVVFLYSEDLALLRMVMQQQEPPRKETTSSQKMQSHPQSQRALWLRTANDHASSVTNDHAMGYGNHILGSPKKFCFAMPKIPTESNLVRVWKRAASNPVRHVEFSSTLASTSSMATMMEDCKDCFSFCYMETHPWCSASAVSGSDDTRLLLHDDAHATKGIAMNYAMTTNYTISRKSSQELQSMSKRQLLQEIQSLLHEVWSKGKESSNTMALDFLRKWRLNSSQDVVLRKVNQKTLQMAYSDLVSGGSWRSKENDLIAISASKNDVDENHDGTVGSNENEERNVSQAVYEERLYQTFCHLLNSHDEISSPNTHEKDLKKNASTNHHHNAIAIFLHETCHLELPVFGNDIGQSREILQKLNVGGIMSAAQPPCHIYVFLGAVRDIATVEYQLLQKACNAMKIPLVGCHLGPVAEFTSKIVSAVAFHSYVGVLNKAVKDLYDIAVAEGSLGIGKMLSNSTSATAAAVGAIDKCRKNTPASTPTIHTICMVPFPIKSLSCELELRDQHHWNLVRVCVASLWRSKVASSSSSPSTIGTTTATTTTLKEYDNERLSNQMPKVQVQNKLTLCFQCGHTMHLDPNDLVLSLAQKHQAAPTEHQILKALCERVPSIIQDGTEHCTKNSNKSLDQLMLGHVQSISLQDLNMDPKKTVMMDCTPFHPPTRNNENNVVQGDNLIHHVYQSPCWCHENWNGSAGTHYSEKDDRNQNQITHLITLISLSNSIDDSKQNGRNQMLHSKIWNELSPKLSFPIIHHAHGGLELKGMRKSSIDAASVTITMLQHFAYHGRLFPAIESLLQLGKKIFGTKCYDLNQQQRNRRLCENDASRSHKHKFHSNKSKNHDMHTEHHDVQRHKRHKKAKR